MRNKVTPKAGLDGMRACLAVSAIMMMGLHGSARADSKQDSQASPPPAAGNAEAAPAPRPDTQDNPATAQAAPAPVAPPVEPAIEGAAPPPYDPPAGFDSPYAGPPPGYPYLPGYWSYDELPPDYHPAYRSPHDPSYEAPLPDEESFSGESRGPYMLSLGFGMGALSAGFSETAEPFRVTEPGMSYTLRFAVAASEKWLVVLGLDGIWTQFSDARLSGSSDWSSTTYTVGAQHFMQPWLYARLGVGLGCMKWSGEYGDDANCKGMAASGGAGFEFYRQYSMSIAAELAGTIVRFTTHDGGPDGDVNDVWYSLGGNVVLSFF